VISLLKSIDDLEQLTALHEAASHTLSMSIEATAHYAVELHPHDAGSFREHLTLLAAQVGRASSVEDYDAVRSSFRGELRDYRDRSHEELTRLRNELKAAATAMETFANSLTASGDEHEAQIEDELRQLQAAARSGDPARMGNAIDHTIKSVSQCCQEMKKGNQMVVAQLQDELRALHLEIEKERRSLYTDRSSGVWNRQKIDGRIDDLVRRSDPFCVLLVGIRNLRSMNVEHSRTVVESSLKSMLARLSGLVGDDVMIGRWSEDVFAVVLDIDPSMAEELRERVEQKISGCYSAQENGLSTRVNMEVSVGVVERAKGADGASFYPKLGQIASIVVEAA